jgi:hypothetical protein
MTVKELVDQLSKLDQDKQITFFSYIETGMSGSWIEVDDCDIVTTEVGDYKLHVEGDEEQDGGYN